MRFNLSTVGYSYDVKDKEMLEGLGFKFNESNSEWQKDEKVDVFIEIETIEQLVAFTDKVGDIILNKDGIIIYDDYRY